MTTERSVLGYENSTVMQNGISVSSGNVLTVKSHARVSRPSLSGCSSRLLRRKSTLQAVDAS